MKFIHWIIAVLLRKFWTVCPRCGKPFGGHQKHQQLVSCDATGKIYRYTCNRCAVELKP
jgi:hypothetical protein